MKKIAFALQVFSLMALLPAFVVFDMNYETGRSAEIHRSPVTKGITEETAIPVTGNSKTTGEAPGVKMDESIPAVNQSCDNPGCTCKKCSCGSDCRCTDIENDHSSSGVNTPSGMKDLFSLLKLQKKS